MARIALTSGAYTARSLLASAQRCCNLYPEVNPTNLDPPAPTTHYLTPGLTVLGEPPTAGVGRGLYRASNGILYAVVGDNVYAVTKEWSFILLGQVNSTAGAVSMKDNESFLMIVDGSPFGYTVDLNTSVFALVPSGLFRGADRVDYLDTFLLFNQPGTPEFYSTLSNEIAFDPLYFAAMTGAPTTGVAVAVMKGYVWVIGEIATEVWYNAGDTNVFPFARMPGQVIQHGCIAKSSIVLCCGNDDTQSCLAWLGQNVDGDTVVLRTVGYAAQAISTQAIENEFRKYPTISDAVAYSRQQDGHAFYVLNFPSADRTWAYDFTTGQWHELVWTDDNGTEHRHRAICAGFAYGKNVGLDWETGTLYEFDLDNTSDNGRAIVRRRGFPHLVQDGKRVMHPLFIADMDTGNDTGEQDGTTGENPPLVYLRWSDDHGHSWGNPIPLSLGATGETGISMMVTRLGMARDRVFELFWSAETATALNGAWIEPIPLIS